MSSMSVMEASVSRTRAVAAKLAAMSAAKDAAVLFRYVRPPLASLDPVNKPADLVRLLCIATELARVTRMHTLTEGYVSTKLNAVFIEYFNGASAASATAELVRYCVNPRIDIRLVNLFPDTSVDGVAYKDKMTSNIMRIQEMHRFFGGVASAFDITAVWNDGSPATLERITGERQAMSYLRFHETWGTWDITNPSNVLTREQIQDPPPESVLSNPGFVELMATLEHFSEGKWTFTHGPTTEERYKMWSPKSALRGIVYNETAWKDRLDLMASERKTPDQIDAIRQSFQIHIDEMKKKVNEVDIVRKKLARHLVQNPRIFIDMKTDPVCPWKGLRLFHGTDFAELQDGVNPSAGAGSSGTHIPCKLSWDEYMNEDGMVANRTAFVTPYYAKSCIYGKHVFTYELSVPGESLKMLDLRNDYVVSTHKHDELDPFKDIYELAGIPYGRASRVEKAVDLYHLFKDSGVDGIILNSDVEWIFFNAGSVLDWVAPRLFKDVLIPLLINKDIPPQVKGTHVVKDRKQLYEDASEFVTMVFADRGGFDNIVKLFVKSLADSAVDLSLSSLPITRWTLDAEDDPYMPQFATGLKGVSSSRLWNSFQLPVAEDTGLIKIKAYECEYHKLWQFVCPEFDNMWMGDVITEGKTDRRPSLPYHQLIIKLRELKVTLLVHLPNGHTQLVPPIKQPDGKYDRRMYIKEAVKRNNDIKLLDMPIRDVYRPAGSPVASSTTATRGADDEEQAAASSSSNKKSKTGLAGKLCIC